MWHGLKIRQYFNSSHIIEVLDHYTAKELTEITQEFATEFEMEVEEGAAEMIARSTDGMPKQILDRMRFIRDYAIVKTSSKNITAEIVSEALKMLTPDQQVHGRLGIPSEVRREVWRRDGGKCVKCGSRQNLEYDHIIAVSQGGSNTARNIELLCEVCNRAKGASIQ